MVVADDNVVRWMADEMGFAPAPARGLAIHHDGQIVGGIAYWRFQYEDGELMDVELSMALKRPQSLTREVLYLMLAYPFRQLGVERVTARCAVGNVRSEKIVKWLGFTLEGVLRRGRFPDHRLYGILRSEYEHHF